MRVYLRGRDGCMPQHLLYGADVSAMRQEMRGEAVTQHVRRDDFRIQSGGGGAFLQHLENPHARELPPEPGEEHVAIRTAGTVEGPARLER